MHPHDSSFKEFDIGLVTMQSGVKFIGQYLHAPGIDWFWSPLKGQPRPDFFNDEEIDVEKIEND